MGTGIAEAVSEEETLVAELELLGIRYLSRQTPYHATQIRPPDRLLIDLARQPTARVREALIAVFLACPGYAQAVPAAVTQLDATNPAAATDLRLLYTAAVFLQREYAPQLGSFPNEDQPWLPDLFSAGFGLPGDNMPAASELAMLGQVHREATGVLANWTGTYHNVARKLIRRREMEQMWSQNR